MASSASTDLDIETLRAWWVNLCHRRPAKQRTAIRTARTQPRSSAIRPSPGSNPIKLIDPTSNPHKRAFQPVPLTLDTHGRLILGSFREVWIDGSACDARENGDLRHRDYSGHRRPGLALRVSECVEGVKAVLRGGGQVGADGGEPLGSGQSA